MYIYIWNVPYTLSELMLLYWKKSSHIELWKIEHKCWTWEKNWKCNNIKSKKYKSISFFICTSFSEYLVKDVKKRRLSKPKSLFPLCGRHENRGKELVLADIVILTQLIYGKLQDEIKEKKSGKNQFCLGNCLILSPFNCSN